MIIVDIKYVHFDIVNYPSADFPVLVKEEFTINAKADVEELYNNLSELIGENKNDGFYIKVLEVQENVYVSIELNVYESFDENPDYSYIISFFDSLPKETEELINKAQEENDEIQYFISLSTFDKSEIETIKKELESDGIKLIIFNHSIHRQEQGAGGWWETMLIGIATNFSSDTIKKVFNKLSDKINLSDFDIKKLDYNRLLENVAEVTNTNSASLTIGDIDDLEENNYKVTIINRYKTFIVKCDYKGNIISLKTNTNSYTNI